MSSELVERLRSHREAFGVHYEPREVEVCIEAAARIEALEGALSEIEKARPELKSNHDYSRGWNDALFRVSQIARRAREGGNEDG